MKNKKILRNLLIGTILGTITATTQAVGVSTNITLANDYIWRGLPQHGKETELTLSGGFDYDFANGFAIGVWGANVSAESEITPAAVATITGTKTLVLGKSAVVEQASIEVDLYASYGGEVQGFGYELGYISYRYPNADSLNFEEFYIGGTYGDFALTYFLGQDEANDNIEAAYGTSFEGIDLTLIAGDYDNSNKYYSIGFAKSYAQLDFGLTISRVNYDDGTDNDTNTVVSISKSF